MMILQIVGVHHYHAQALFYQYDPSTIKKKRVILCPCHAKVRRDVWLFDPGTVNKQR